MTVTVNALLPAALPNGSADLLNYRQRQPLCGQKSRDRPSSGVFSHITDTEECARQCLSVSFDVPKVKTCLVSQ